MGYDTTLPRFGNCRFCGVFRMRVAIIGTGYVGLTTGVCLAFIGHTVSCLDTDEAKIEALKSGHIPIYEPYLKELLEEARHNLSFTSCYAEAIPEADVVFIAVGTPPTPSGAPNLEFLSQAARSIGQNGSKRFTVVVNKSTVPIGSGNWVGSLLRDCHTAAAKRLIRGLRGRVEPGVSARRHGSA